VSSAAVGLTIPTETAASGATRNKRVNNVLIRCATANVRWRDDGTDPTASVGVPLNAGEVLSYDGNPQAIKFIRQSADATLDIAMYS
jgi:hypothetical protein